MERYTAGSKAPYGLYLSTKPLDIRLVNGEGEHLEGLRDASYMRLPMWMVVLFGPAFGGAFVLLFPLLVLASPIAALMGRLKTADDHAYVVRGGFQPAMSYFKGEGEETHGDKGEGADPNVADLQDEVKARLDESGDK